MITNKLLKAYTNHMTRRYLLACLEDPRFPHGRTLEFLTRAAGQLDTPEGQEATRKLLRGVHRGAKRARILLRDEGHPETWGLRVEA